LFDGPVDPSRLRLTADEVYSPRGITSVRISPFGTEFAAVVCHAANVVLEDGFGQDTPRSSGRPRPVTKPFSDLTLTSTQDGAHTVLRTSVGSLATLAWAPKAVGQYLAAYSGEKEAIEILSAASGNVEYTLRHRIFIPPLDPGDDDLGGIQWSPRGDLLLIATREEPKTQLLVVSVDGTNSQRLLNVDGTLVSWDWSPDGTTVVAVTRAQNAWSGSVVVIDVATQRVTELAVESNFEYCKPVARWSPDGSIVLRSNRSGWSKLWRLDANNSTLAEPITRGDWDDYAFQVSSDGLLVFSSKSGQPGTGDDLWLINSAGSGRDPERLTNHPGVKSPLGWGASDSVIYRTSRPTEAPTIWRVDSHAKIPPKQLWNSMALSLKSKLAEPREFRIPGQAGLLSALLYLPVSHQSGEKHPGIVWVRGGPTAASRFQWAPYLSWLANEGFAVLTVNYRGSVGEGAAHMEAVAGEGLGQNDLTDVLAAAAYLRSMSEVDITRGIGIGGRSWGGYLSLMAATRNPEVFACCYAGAAISDWLIQQSETEVRYYDRWLVGGWTYEKRAHATGRSPITELERLSIPLLITHGAEDHDVPFRQIEEFVQKARELGKHVEASFYSHEGHSNKMPVNQRDELDRVSGFFRRWLHPWDFIEIPSSNQIPY